MEAGISILWQVASDGHEVQVALARCPLGIERDDAGAVRLGAGRHDLRDRGQLARLPDLVAVREGCRRRTPADEQALRILILEGYAPIAGWHLDCTGLRIRDGLGAVGQGLPMR